MLIATGALSGFLAGLFGIGGGAVLVPVFYECFRLAGVPLEVRMPLCIGTSLAVIIPTSIRSFRAHYAPRRGRHGHPASLVAADRDRRGRRQRRLRAMRRSGCSNTSSSPWPGRPPLRLWLARDSWKFGDEMPKGPLMKVYGFLVGLLSTLMGVGGGLFSNLLMTFYGRPIHQAVATSSALAVLISIPGALGYVYAGWPVAARYPGVAALQMPLAFGYVSLIGAVLVMPMSLLTAPLGVQGRACDVKANAGSRVRRLSLHRRRPVCDKPNERAVVVFATI